VAAASQGREAAFVSLKPGDFVLVKVTKAGVATLNAQPLARTTLAEAGPLMQQSLGIH